MPVSKKKKYTKNQFTNTLGYRKNTHRDKSGKTQQERDKEHQEHISRATSRPTNIYDYMVKPNNHF